MHTPHTSTDNECIVIFNKKHWYMQAHPRYIRFDHNGVSAQSAIRIQPATITEYNSMPTNWRCLQSNSQSLELKNLWIHTFQCANCAFDVEIKTCALDPYHLRPFPKITKNWLISSLQKSEKCENAYALCCQNGPMQLDDCKSRSANLKPLCSHVTKCQR